MNMYKQLQGDPEVMSSVAQVGKIQCLRKTNIRFHKWKNLLPE